MVNSLRIIYYHSCLVSIIKGHYILILKNGKKCIHVLQSMYYISLTIRNIHRRIKCSLSEEYYLKKILKLIYQFFLFLAEEFELGLVSNHSSHRDLYFIELESVHFSNYIQHRMC